MKRRLAPPEDTRPEKRPREELSLAISWDGTVSSLFKTPSEGICKTIWSLLLPLLFSGELHIISCSSKTLYDWTWQYLIPNSDDCMLLSHIDSTPRLDYFLSKVSSLTTLDIQGCAVAFSSLQALSHIKALRYLELPHIPLEDADFLTHLTTLGLLSIHKGIDVHFNRLSMLTDLQYLKLGDASNKNFSLGFPNFTKLISLRITGDSEFRFGFDAISNLTNLQILSINTRHVFHASSPSIVMLTKLTKLDFEGPLKVVPEVAYLTGLTELLLTSVSADDKVIVKIAENLMNLRSFELRFSEDTDIEAIVSDVGAEQMAKLTNLFELQLCGHDMSDLAVRHFCSGLTSLRAICLDDMEFTSAIFRPLSTLPFLIGLSLCHTCGFADANFRDIELLTQIKDLNLFNTGMSDDHFDSICSLTQLELLDCGKNNIVGVCFRWFHRLKNLQTLNLDYSMLLGFETQLLFLEMFLPTLPSLTSLSLGHWGLPEHTVEELRLAWPGIEISFPQIDYLDQEHQFDF